MTDTKSENLENEQPKNQPKKPDDGAGFLVEGFVRISDPVTKESIVEIRA
jgi:hypothetical protein